MAFFISRKKSHFLRISHIFLTNFKYRFLFDIVKILNEIYQQYIFSKNNKFAENTLSTMTKKNFHIISHTHWDREWYLTFEQFRMKLVDLIDNLIELLEKDKNFKYFHLDGQMIILEDYLEIKPEKKEKLLRLIRDGRILVGPSYIQNDEFLTSGESHIRNLHWGRKLCQQYGVKPMMVGYFPDQFGHISQLPQILKGFDIKSTVFARGYKCEGDRKAEFIWKSPDGSDVLAVAMIFMYNNAQRLPDDINLSVRLIENLKNDFETKTTTNHLLLLNGVDHLEAQENLSVIIKKLNKTYENKDKIIHSTLPQYVNEIKKAKSKFKTVTGELREGTDDDILNHTLSSRVYLKQLNAKATNLIEKWVEPFWTFLNIAKIKDYPSEYIDYLWKLLLENHPHDSICGCSIDSVHKNMLDRFTRNIEVSEELINRAFKQFSDLIDKSGIDKDNYLLIIFNPTQEKRTEIIQAHMDFLADEKVKNFAIKNSNKNPIPYILLQKKFLSKRLLSPINIATAPNIDRFEISFLAEEIPPFGYKTYIISKEKGLTISPIETKKNLKAGESIENKYYKITFNKNGSINIKDKENGFVFKNLLLFEDEEDCGDEYLFRIAPNSKAYNTNNCKAKFKKIFDNKFSKTVQVQINWELPSRNYINPGKIDYKKKKFPITYYLTILKDSKRIDIRCIIENQIYNHRLRVLFPTGIKSNKSVAGAQFDMIKRPIKLPEKWNRSNDHPSWNFVNVSDGKNGLAIFHKGLHSYKLKDDKHRTIALTLLRGVEWLTFADRDSGEGKYQRIETYSPDAQCLGENTFEFSIYPHSCKDNLYLKAEEFTNPLMYHNHSVDKEKWMFSGKWNKDKALNIYNIRENKYSNLPRLPVNLSFFSIKSKRSVVSAIKKADNSNNIIIRIFNPYKQTDLIKIKSHKPLKALYEVNLTEKRICKININKSDTFSRKLEGKKIVTFELELIK